MRQTLLLLGMALALTGCARQSSSPCCVEVPTHPPAAKRGLTVSVLPVQMAVDSSLPWHLEEELVAQIATAIQERTGWRVASSESAAWQAALVKDHSTFSPDLAPFQRLQGGSDLVVVSELIEHQEVAYTGQKMQSLHIKDGEVETILAMKLRVRVVDLRGLQPKILLQEIVHSNHMVRKHERRVDYRQMGWGSHGYEETAVGVAHQRLGAEVASRIDRYASFMQ